MKINPKTLEKLREARGLDQQALAERAGVSPRTVLRIEIGESVETRQSTVEGIAKVLRIKDLKVLAQEPESEAVINALVEAMPRKKAIKEEENKEHQKRPFAPDFRRVPFRLYSQTILAYDLVAEKYGIDAKQIVNAAPLLFTLLAEMSLADRLRRAEKTQAAFDAANATLPDYLGGRGWDDTFRAEKQSIGARELFYSRGSEDQVDYFEEEGRNPFSDFLKQLAKELGPDSDAIDPEEIYFDPDGFLNYVPLFESYRKELTCDSPRADYALSRGYVRIGQIPKELLGEGKDVTDKRKKWLEDEDKVPDEEWAEYEERMRPLREATAKIINKSLNEGGVENA